MGQARGNARVSSRGKPARARVAKSLDALVARTRQDSKC